MTESLYLDMMGIFGSFWTHFVLCVSRKQLEELQQAQMLRGNLSAAEQLSLLSSHDDLQQALEGAFFVQV